MKRKHSLFDKSRFLMWERKKDALLQKLTVKGALMLEEALLSSYLIWEWRKNFSKDKPVCLKLSLKKRSA